MRLVEIDETTEGTFYRCLHDEIPADPRVMAMRREWRAKYQPKGHRGKVMIDDLGQVVGLTNYIPVEHSPYEGENLMAILCMWIHGYDHLVGNQQSRGYGRFMLKEIEADALNSGCNGVTVWAKDYAAWNPVSFYEHMGYERVDQSGLDVLVWKRFNQKAKPPSFLKRQYVVEVGKTGKIQVTSISNGWCRGGCQQCVMVRDAVAEIGSQAVLTEVYAHEKSDMRVRGESIDVVYIDGDPFRPDGPPATKSEFKQAVLERFTQRNS